MKCLKLFILTKLDLLGVSSNSLQWSRKEMRTLTMIQVVGVCKLLEIRKQLQKLMARGCQMALKFTAYQLHINPLKTKHRLLYLKTQFVPRSKHFSSRL
jgi:hypothetical protein